MKKFKDDTNILKQICDKPKIRHEYNKIEIRRILKPLCYNLKLSENIEYRFFDFEALVNYLYKLWGVKE